MSRAKGLFGLCLAAAFGIVNGVIVFEPLLKDQKRQEIQDLKSTELLNKTSLTSSNNDNAAASLVSKEPEKQQPAHVPPMLPSLWTNLNFWLRKGIAKEQEGKEKASETTNSPEKTSLSDGVPPTDTTMKISKPREVAFKESTTASWWPTWK